MDQQSTGPDRGWGPGYRLDGKMFHNEDVELFIHESGRGRPLVFLHGLGSDHSNWRRQIERLSSRYRVIALDTRGHGQSSQAPGPYSMQLFASDLACVFEALGLRDAVLVGFSQGGMTAQLFAAQRPDLLRGLCLVSTACRSDAEQDANMGARIAAMQAQGARASAEIGARAIFSKGFMAAHPDLIEHFVAWRASLPPEPLIASMLALKGYDISPRLPGIDLPAVVIAGANDILTTPAANRLIADLLPRARYVEIPEAGHMLTIEQPALFEAAFDEFLAEVG